MPDVDVVPWVVGIELCNDDPFRDADVVGGGTGGGGGPKYDPVMVIPVPDDPG